jgi:hypothetical protein
MKPGLLIRDIVTFNRKQLGRRWVKLNWILYRDVFPALRKKIGLEKKIHEIPIIINNRNRLSYLLALIEWLEKRKFYNIYIIDNNSSYPPLLQYYNITRHKVFRLNKNVGHMALWKTDIYDRFKRNYYVYTDPDVLPMEDCPDDFMEYFMQKLNQYKSIEKIGFGLKIDDLPEHYSDKKKVIEWEEQFWARKVEENIYDAHIDTTFALYRPLTNYLAHGVRAYRTAGRYIARHLPWYENSAMPTEEDSFYRKNVRLGASHWITPFNEK